MAHGWSSETNIIKHQGIGWFQTQLVPKKKVRSWLTPLAVSKSQPPKDFGTKPTNLQPGDRCARQEFFEGLGLVQTHHQSACFSWNEQLRPVWVNTKNFGTSTTWSLNPNLLNKYKLSQNLKPQVFQICPEVSSGGPPKCTRRPSKAPSNWSMMPKTRVLAPLRWSPWATFYMAKIIPKNQKTHELWQLWSEKCYEKCWFFKFSMSLW